MAAGVIAIAAGVALPGPASTHAVASVALGRGPAAIPGAESAPGAARTSAASPALETPLLRKLALPAGARVTVHVDGGAVTGFAHGPDLAAALAEMGVRVGETDVIRDDGGHFADLLGDLQSGGEFSVARVTHVLRSTELSLPFATREVPDATLTLDTRRTEQEGRPGVREQVHDVTLEDGREVARTLVSDSVAAAPVDQVVRVGTRPPPLPADPAYAVVKTVNGSATSYCDYGTTATGTRAGPGSIAVDPSVIRLGSHLYVSGYGFGYAVDTGGAVLGTIVDVWYPTCAQSAQWGRRPATIYVLDH